MVSFRRRAFAFAGSRFTAASGAAGRYARQQLLLLPYSCVCDMIACMSIDACQSTVQGTMLWVCNMRRTQHLTLGQGTRLMTLRQRIKLITWTVIQQEHVRPHTLGGGSMSQNAPSESSKRTSSEAS